MVISILAPGDLCLTIAPDRAAEAAAQARALMHNGRTVSADAAIFHWDNDDSCNKGWKKRIHHGRLFRARPADGHRILAPWLPTGVDGAPP